MSQVQCWRPPPNDTMKFNVDASFKQDTGQACLAIVGRDHNGKIGTGLTKKTFAGSPLIAEALAVREAISFATNLNINWILIESDNMELISACRQEKEIGEIMAIIRDVGIMKEKIHKCGFTWIGRDGNSLAHTLAQMTQRNSLPNNWCWNPPHCIKVIVEKEKRSFQQDQRNNEDYNVFHRNTHSEESRRLNHQGSSLQMPPGGMGQFRGLPHSFPPDPGTADAT